MSEGAYALIGVFVGGTLNGFVAWVLARLRTGEEARAAALLVSEELMLSTVPLLELRGDQRWGVLLRMDAFGRTDQWETYRALLGRTLAPGAWQTLSVAYVGLAGAKARALQHDPTDGIQAAEGRALAETYLTTTHALAHLTPLMYRPPWWKIRSRRKYDKKHGVDLERRWKDSPAGKRLEEWQRGRYSADHES